jgi:hypothetical protein
MSDDILRRLERIEAGIAVLAELIHGMAPVKVQEPGGADSLPDPVPGEGIASYAMRCGQFVGGEKGAQAVRGAGGLFGGMGQHLVNKHGGKWKPAIWEFIHGDPAYVPDPAWGSYQIR